MMLLTRTLVLVQTVSLAIVLETRTPTRSLPVPLRKTTRITSQARMLKSEAIPQSFALPPDVVPVLRRYHLRRLSWTPIPLRLSLLLWALISPLLLLLLWTLLLLLLPSWTPRPLLPLPSWTPRLLLPLPSWTPRLPLLLPLPSWTPRLPLLWTPTPRVTATSPNTTFGCMHLPTRRRGRCESVWSKRHPERLVPTTRTSR